MTKSVIKPRPLDFIIAAFFLSGAVFSVILNRPQKGSVISVSADGRKYEYSLKQDGTYSVNGSLGKTVFQIKGGKVRIIDSPCAGKQCIHQGTNLPLVCLPNRVIITMEKDGEFDAVSE